MKKITIVFSVILILAMAGIFSVVSFIFNRATKTTAGVVNKTFNSTNVLYNYDWFYHEYHSSVSLRAKMFQAQQAVVSYEKTLPAHKSKWTQQEQFNVSNLQSIATGLQFQLDDVVQTYNAHASELNRGIFKAHNLPRKLVM